jgi:cell division protein FtsB
VPGIRNDSGGRGRVLFAACLVFACYFVYTAAAGAFRTHQLAEDRDAVRAEVEALEQQVKHLTAVRDYVASDLYVEQEARRQLGYVRDGEIPFVVISPPLEENDQPKGEWWERLFPR